MSEYKLVAAPVEAEMTVQWRDGTLFAVLLFLLRAAGLESKVMGAAALG
jgi:hypothetical protein